QLRSSASSAPRNIVAGAKRQFLSVLAWRRLRASGQRPGGARGPKRSRRQIAQQRSVLRFSSHGATAGGSCGCGKSNGAGRFGSNSRLWSLALGSGDRGRSSRRYTRWRKILKKGGCPYARARDGLRFAGDTLL